MSGLLTPAQAQALAQAQSAAARLEADALERAANHVASVIVRAALFPAILARAPAH